MTNDDILDFCEKHGCEGIEEEQTDGHSKVIMAKDGKKISKDVEHRYFDTFMPIAFLSSMLVELHA